MVYLARWGNKGFLINPNRIVPLLDITTGFARKTDTNNDTSGTPTTNTRGMELQKITLQTRYLAAAGNDPRGQIEEWKAQFGKRYPLYINEKQFGPDLLELESVDFENIELDNRGRFLAVDATVTLVEYVPPTTTVSQKNTTTASTATAASAAKTTGTKSGAIKATASSVEKETKKKTVKPARTLKGVTRI